MKKEFLNIEKEKILIINDCIDIKITKTSTGYNITILENLVNNINVLFSNNCEDFE